MDCELETIVSLSSDSDQIGSAVGYDTTEWNHVFKRQTMIHLLIPWAEGYQPNQKNARNMVKHDSVQHMAKYVDQPQQQE